MADEGVFASSQWEGKSEEELLFESFFVGKVLYIRPVDPQTRRPYLQ